METQAHKGSKEEQLRRFGRHLESVLRAGSPYRSVRVELRKFGLGDGDHQAGIQIALGILDRLDLERCSSVQVLQSSDATILHLAVDLLKPQRQIVSDFKRMLRERRLLYRRVDERLFEAARLRREEGLTYAEASMRVFGTPKMGERIRNLTNKLNRNR